MKLILFLFTAFVLFILISVVVLPPIFDLINEPSLLSIIIATFFFFIYLWISYFYGSFVGKLATKLKLL